MSDKLLCRVCQSTENLKSIFNPGKILGRKTTLSTLLGDLLNYQIDEQDHLSHYLCSKCMISLIKAHKFQQRCFDAYKQFVTIEPSKEELPEKHDEYEIITEFSTLPKAAAESEQIQYVEVIEEEEAEEEQESEPQQPASTKKPTPRKNSYKCEVCGKVLKRLFSYKYHMQTHSDTNSFKCGHCNESFKTRNAYEGHVAIHEEKHTCEICQKKYRQAASLRSHMLTHTGVKPWKCDICGKGMTQKSGFKKHMLTHMDVKPHTCEYCQKTFKFSSNLFVHLRSHTGERKYECEVCGRKFTGSEQLKRHNLIHTGEKPFSCSTCQKAFNRRSALKVHELLHLPEKKYKCPNEGCTRGFNQPHSLKNHVGSCRVKVSAQKLENVSENEEDDEAIVVYEVASDYPE